MISLFFSQILNIGSGQIDVVGCILKVEQFLNSDFLFNKNMHNGEKII